MTLGEIMTELECIIGVYDHESPAICFLHHSGEVREITEITREVISDFGKPTVYSVAIHVGDCVGKDGVKRLTPPPRCDHVFDSYERFVDRTCSKCGIRYPW